MEIISFFVKERTGRVVLDLQGDLVTKNKDLVDTAAGKEARGQLAEGIEKARRDLEDTKAELRKVLRMRDKDMAPQLHKKSIDSSDKMGFRRVMNLQGGHATKIQRPINNRK